MIPKRPKNMEDDARILIFCLLQRAIPSNTIYVKV
jgi:hypothetical protein